MDNNINTNFNKKIIKNFGIVNNLESFYSKIHILCFPSYLNALGRQVFEAAMFGLPSIVCLSKNSSDSFINKQTGIALKTPGSIKNLEKAIISFYENRKFLKQMGKKASILVKKKFDKKKNLQLLENIYEDIFLKFLQFFYLLPHVLIRYNEHRHKRIYRHKEFHLN